MDILYAAGIGVAIAFIIFVFRLLAPMSLSPKTSRPQKQNTPNEDGNYSPGYTVPETGDYKCVFCTVTAATRRNELPDYSKIRTRGGPETVRHFERGSRFSPCPSCGPATGWFLIRDSPSKAHPPPSEPGRGLLKVDPATLPDYIQDRRDRSPIVAVYLYIGAREYRGHNQTYMMGSEDLAPVIREADRKENANGRFVEFVARNSFATSTVIPVVTDSEFEQQYLAPIVKKHSSHSVSLLRMVRTQTNDPVYFFVIVRAQ